MVRCDLPIRRDHVARLIPLMSGAMLLAAPAHAQDATGDATGDATRLPPLQVSQRGDAPSPLNIDALLQADATTAEGYRATYLSAVGPLGPMRTLDTPYSIDVIPSSLLENTQSTSTDDVFKLDPFTQSAWPADRGNPMSVKIRGFTTNTMTIDNMRTWNLAVVDLEGMERVEVIRGLTGFLYGATDPGGLVNFVTKRPTATPLANITVGDMGIGPLTNGAGYVHADFGGPIGTDGKFGYRINIAGQYGDTAIDQQDLNRNYLSAAFDWKITDDILAQVNVFHSYYNVSSPSPFWFFGGDARHVPAPSAQRSWSEPWAYYRNEQNGAEARVTWEINDVFTARSGFLYLDQSSPAIAINNYVFTNNGTYTQGAIPQAAGTLQTYSGYAALDATFATGPLNHKVTAGYFGQQYISTLAEDNAVFPSVSGDFNFLRPYYATMPAFTVGNRPKSTYFTRTNQNIVLGDQIDLGPLSIIGGVTYALIQQVDYTYLPAAGTHRTLDSTYDDGALTPSISALYKIAPNFTVYATYIQGLEPGDTAPSTAINAGEVFAPSIDTQYEAGAKLELGGALLTLAVFDIDKAYAFLGTDNIYQVAGREVHKGVEFGLSGKVLPELTLFGGVTFLDPVVENDPTYQGLKPINVSSEMAKLYGEYAVAAVPGLTLTGGVYYYGRFAANALNTEFLPGYVTEDLGLRYETKVNNLPLTARLNVANITNKSYWMSSYFVGAPREVSLSVSARF